MQIIDVMGVVLYINMRFLSFIWTFDILLLLARYHCKCIILILIFNMSDYSLYHWAKTCILCINVAIFSFSQASWWSCSSRPASRPSSCISVTSSHNCQALVTHQLNIIINTSHSFYTLHVRLEHKYSFSWSL